ncbi:MAG: hypothetical protein HN368_06705, partial [Spirochaetales bacterium]|nr:hypothetical protein [Spirochaetales bacterium]
SAMDAQTAERLGIDQKKCDENYRRLMEEPMLTQKITKVYDTQKPQDSEDADLQIYSGGFFGDKDIELFQTVRETAPEHLVNASYAFEDERAKKLLWRFIGRNYPHYVDGDYLSKWKSFCASRILFPPIEGALNIRDFTSKIAQMKRDTEVPAGSLSILQKLSEYGDFLNRNILDYED